MWAYPYVGQSFVYRTRPHKPISWRVTTDVDLSSDGKVPVDKQKLIMFTNSGIIIAVIFRSIFAGNGSDKHVVGFISNKTLQCLHCFLISLKSFKFLKIYFYVIFRQSNCPRINLKWMKTCFELIDIWFMLIKSTCFVTVVNCHRL